MIICKTFTFTVSRYAPRYIQVNLNVWNILHARHGTNYIIELNIFYHYNLCDGDDDNICGKIDFLIPVVIQGFCFTSFLVNLFNNIFFYESIYCNFI